MLLVLHGQSDTSDTNQFLKQLHVFDEIKKIDARVKECHGRFDIDKIRVLAREDTTHALQLFINTVIKYADSLSVEKPAVLKQVPTKPTPKPKQVRPITAPAMVKSSQVKRRTTPTPSK